MSNAWSDSRTVTVTKKGDTFSADVKAAGGISFITSLFSLDTATTGLQKLAGLLFLAYVVLVIANFLINGTWDLMAPFSMISRAFGG